jgi:hypothetical protein
MSRVLGRSIEFQVKPRPSHWLKYYTPFLILRRAGMTVGGDGTVQTLRFEDPAYRAGISPGSKIVSVESEPCDDKRFQELVENLQERVPALEIERKGRKSTVSPPLKAGSLYPVLSGSAGGRDVLMEIVRPLPQLGTPTSRSTEAPPPPAPSLRWNGRGGKMRRPLPE